MVESFNSRITQLGENFAMKSRSANQFQIDTGKFDKTFVGRVIDKTAKYSSHDDSGYINKWVVCANGTTYTINAENTNINSVGQKVRLYIPSNNREGAYAEVINPTLAPDGITYMKNVLSEDSEWYDATLSKAFEPMLEYAMNTESAAQSKKDGKLELDVIVERWITADTQIMEKMYYVTLEDGHCTNLICPDGKVINLIGW